MPAYTPLTRAEMAQRLARDIPDGWHVNLGIGMPTLVADHIPADREVVIHSENGILGMGPVPVPEAADAWVINAGKQLVTLRPGASYMHHADSFAIVRGGHLNLCVLGGFEVAENGDLANWASSGEGAPAVGGAMDLAVGAKRIWVMMDHTTRAGAPKLVERCSYPLTAPGVVARIYTSLCVLDVVPQGLQPRYLVPGLSMEALRGLTAARVLDPIEKHFA